MAALTIGRFFSLPYHPRNGRTLLSFQQEHAGPGGGVRQRKKSLPKMTNDGGPVDESSATPPKDVQDEADERASKADSVDDAASAPSSPDSLTRRPSFSNSSSYQEDWETFPPLDKISVFDFLDDFDLMQRIARWQQAIKSQKEKMKRQREKLKASSSNARDLVVGEWKRRAPTAEEQLDKYRRQMMVGVERLGKQVTVTAREKVAFIAGVLNVFISGYLIGAFPEKFYIWFSVQLLFFMPIRYYRYHKRGYHFFLFDLCYFVDFLAMLSIWVFPNSKRLFISTFCLAFGNNAIAIAMWRNSLVFHSMDKVVRYVPSFASCFLLSLSNPLYSVCSSISCLRLPCTALHT